jgi:hypothetical protein
LFCVFLSFFGQLDIVADQTICWIRSIETTLSECPWVEPSDAPYTHVSPIQSLLEDKNPGDEVISEHLAPNAQQARRHSELLFQGYHGAVTGSPDFQLLSIFNESPSDIIRFRNANGRNLSGFANFRACSIPFLLVEAL